jgi:hypothetical protein
MAKRQVLGPGIVVTETVSDANHRTRPVNSASERRRRVPALVKYAPNVCTQLTNAGHACPNKPQANGLCFSHDKEVHARSVETRNKKRSRFSMNWRRDAEE